MNVLHFLIGSVVVLCVSAQSLPYKVEDLINQTIVECKVKENATDDDVAILFSEEDWPETYEGKCFIECFFNEIGIVRISFKVSS